MLSAPHYLPILKLKKGELQALEQLNTELDDLPLTPFFDITPLTEDAGDDAGEDEEQPPPGPIHVEETVKDIMKHWGRSSIVYLDALALDLHPPTYPRALRDISLQASGTDFQFVPTTGLRRSEEYQKAAMYAAEEQENGLCLRVTENDVDREDFSGLVNQFLKFVEMSPEEIDLILDYKSIPAGHEDHYTRKTYVVITELPGVEKWRSLAVVGTSFPGEINEKVSDYQTAAFDRAVWKMYRQVFEKRDRLARTPVFGDYGITRPSMEKYRVRPDVMNVTPQIKYTAEDQYVIVRGEYREDDPYKQYRDLARRLREIELFEAGQTHADEIIHQYAEGAGSTAGGPQTWVKVGTARHLEKVGQQIANLLGT